MDHSAGQLELPLFSRDCLSKTGQFAPDVLAIEAGEVTMSCRDSGININTCNDPNLARLIATVDGLGFSSVIAKTQNNITLPAYLPIIPRDFFKFGADLISPDFVGVTLKDIISSQPSKYAGMLHISKIKLREDSLDKPMFQGKKVILFLSGKDALIEVLWRERRELRFFERLSQMGFEAITAINFSVFFGECVIGQQHNLKKSLKSFEELQSLGVTAIPHIYWQNTSQLIRWIEWMKHNSEVKLVSINCQRYRKNDYPLIQSGIKHILNSVSRDMHILLEGPPRAFLEDLSDYATAIHVAMEEPAYDAIFHKQKLMQGKKLTTARTNKKLTELVGGNVNSYGEYLIENFYRR